MENERNNKRKKTTKLKKVVRDFDIGKPVQDLPKDKDEEISSRYAFLKDTNMSTTKSQKDKKV